MYACIEHRRSTFIVTDTKPAEQTDMPRFIALYASFGIVLEPYDNLDGGWGIFIGVLGEDWDRYANSRVYFDGEEKFVNQEFFDRSADEPVLRRTYER